MWVAGVKPRGAWEKYHPPKWVTWNQTFFLVSTPLKTVNWMHSYSGWVGKWHCIIFAFAYLKKTWPILICAIITTKKTNGIITSKIPLTESPYVVHHLIYLSTLPRTMVLAWSHMWAISFCPKVLKEGLATDTKKQLPVNYFHPAQHILLGEGCPSKKTWKWKWKLELQNYRLQKCLHQFVILCIK